MLFFTNNVVESSKKKSIVTTHLQNLAIKRLSNTKIYVDVDPQIGRAKRTNHHNCVSYLGVLAQTKTFIVEPDWDHVSKVEKNMIWQDLCVS